MIYKIQHSLTYEFSAPVYLEPHILYLKPRTDNSQKLLSFDLNVEPQPIFTANNTDVIGNPEMRVWFQGLSHFLNVQAVSMVETERTNPFDFLLDSGCASLPVRYTPSGAGVLQAFRRKRHYPPDIRVFSSGLAHEAGGDTMGFLMNLVQTISRTFRKVRREEGFAWPAVKTLAARTGSCRDLSILFMACCSEQGLASRFVSGYFDGEGAQNFRKELHSWVEVYLEGGGWRGFDPMNGIAVFDRHVALMSAPSARRTAPVIGKFRGGNVTTELRCSVTMTAQTAESVFFQQQQQQQQ